VEVEVETAGSCRASLSESFAYSSFVTCDRYRGDTTNR
jgi:hypothetical protein